MDTDAAKRDVRGAVDARRGDLLRVSRALHANPELAFQEVRSCALLSEACESAGLSVERGAHGLETAFAAEFGRPGAPCVAFLAEYDALPEIGHACGHNLIATAALGAALALADLGPALPGRVRLLGTPAEESGCGKERMARQGAFDGVDAAMMVHPAGFDLITMPSIALAEVEAIYRGCAAHAAAMPERGVNALDGLVIAYQAIAALRQHIRSTERIHGVITEGGQAPNVVPDRAAGRFYVRARNAEELETLKRRVAACFEAGALASGAEVAIRWAEVDYLELCTNWPLAEAYRGNAERLGRRFLPLEAVPSGVRGTTDMGNVSHRVPSIHPMIAAAPPHCAIHHPEFATWAGSELGERAALDGAKALAMTALDFFCDASLREQVADAFQRLASDSGGRAEEKLSSRLDT